MTAAQPPRPEDPDMLYHTFERHREKCGSCSTGFLCYYGEHLLEAWGDSDRYYANEQAMIDAIQAEGE